MIAVKHLAQREKSFLQVGQVRVDVQQVGAQIKQRVCGEQVT